MAGEKTWCPDRLDMAAVIALGILSIWAAYLISAETVKPKPPRRVMARVEQPRLDARLQKMLRTADNMMRTTGGKDAEVLIAQLKRELPYDARPQVIEANLFWRRQQTLAAMHAFRRAIDLDLDYLDKKSPLFQGKLIRNVVNEAKEIISAGLKGGVDGERLRAAKKEYYYMLRKLAGGCNE